MKIVSWNVNGIDACRGDFLKFLERSKADVVCCQEIKTQIMLYHRLFVNASIFHVATSVVVSY